VQVAVEAHAEAVVEVHHEDEEDLATVVDVVDLEEDSAAAVEVVASQEAAAVVVSHEVVAVVVVALEVADVEVTERALGLLGCVASYLARRYKTDVLFATVSFRVPRRSPDDTTVFIRRRLGVEIGFHVKDATYGAVLGLLRWAKGTSFTFNRFFRYKVQLKTTTHFD